MEGFLGRGTPPPAERSAANLPQLEVATPADSFVPFLYLSDPGEKLEGEEELAGAASSAGGRGGSAGGTSPHSSAAPNCSEGDPEQQETTRLACLLDMSAINHLAFKLSRCLHGFCSRLASVE